MTLIDREEALKQLEEDWSSEYDEDPGLYRVTQGAFDVIGDMPAVSCEECVDHAFGGDPHYGPCCLCKCGSNFRRRRDDR